ncbi:MAG: HEAT repeat domain-containing protein [Planctomycetota bacterium]
MSDLPEEQRELLLAYGRGGEEWSRLRLAIRDDPARAKWMSENLLLELFRAYDVARLAGMGEERGPFERARDELVFLSDASTPLLVELLSAKDGIVPVVSADVLRKIGEPAVPEVARALAHEDPRARRAAAELLGDLPHVGPEEDDLQNRLARLAREDPEWLVRAQAARSLGLRGANHRTTETARHGLVALLSDEDPAVSREAAQALRLLDDPAAVPALLNYAQRTERAADSRGNTAAQEALQALTRTQGTRNARAWRDLWRDHSTELLDPGPR